MAPGARRRGSSASRSDVFQAPPPFPAPPLPPPPEPAPRGPGGFTAQQDGGSGGERSWRGCGGRSWGIRADGPPAASARAGAPGHPGRCAPGSRPAASCSPGLPRADAGSHRLLRDRPHHRQGQLRCGQAGHAPRHQGQGTGAGGPGGCGLCSPGPSECGGARRDPRPPGLRGRGSEWGWHLGERWGPGRRAGSRGGGSEEVETPADPERETPSRGAKGPQSPGTPSRATGHGKGGPQGCVEGKWKGEWKDGVGTLRGPADCKPRRLRNQQLGNRKGMRAGAYEMWTRRMGGRQG
ncbi:Hypothetical predicted protein [Marmota monax]|uniref:Uncharacterized protein n=1 Tax=Marmota monax TaxID=9995 RepID=A0A5E4A2K7_MARMO|nr:hypothetical protein GHT09_000934 [Marmota monax]VTJ51513.1 Hypothetical predicted protein [Marmota monax]